MVWITGVGRGETGMVVELQRNDGTRTRAPLEKVDDIAQPLVSGPLSRRHVNLDLTTMRPSSTSAYLRGLGLEALEPGDQVVYEAETEVGIVVIPVQLLIAALIASTRAAREILLGPWGPSHFMTTFSSGTALETTLTPNRSMRTPAHKIPNTVSRYEWMLSYPSGHKAWGSVYRRALDGQLDMTLPKAIIDVSIRARCVGTKLMVAQLMARRLLPLEEPFEFAKGLAAKEFVLLACPSRTHRAAAPLVVEEGLQSRAMAGPLSDEQWKRIHHVLTASGPLQLHCSPQRLRMIIDVILFKLGTPCSWKKMPPTMPGVAHAVKVLSRLRKAGVWGEVVKELTREKQGRPLAPSPLG